MARFQDFFQPKTSEQLVSGEKVEKLIEIIDAGGPICRFCLSPFEPHELPFHEGFQLRAVLLIPDSAPTPMTCDPCLARTVATFNHHATNVGTRNDGHTNLALAHLG